MNEIATIKGLPKTDQVLPEFFKPIGCRVRHPFYKACFMDEYGMYCAITSGNAVQISVDSISTAIVKDKKGNPIMYAYVIGWEKEYVLMEIGEMQVYRVAKDKIDIEEVLYHRLPFAETEKGLAIMVRNDEKEGYVRELWLRDANTNEENKLDFPGGSLKEAYSFLQEQELVK